MAKPFCATNKQTNGLSFSECVCESRDVHLALAYAKMVGGGNSTIYHGLSSKKNCWPPRQHGCLPLPSWSTFVVLQSSALSLFGGHHWQTCINRDWSILQLADFYFLRMSSAINRDWNILHWQTFLRVLDVLYNVLLASL